jgi:3-hydroxyacyl-CoA dehydrogenase/enoyl-CoA hydratase/3-hydroxybutyryl-CoA epimerase
MELQDFRHWRIDYDLDQVAWLTLDRAGERNNSLSVEVLQELGAIVDLLEADPPRGLVLQSGKPGSFIVGADIREFGAVEDQTEAAESIRQAHQLLNRVEALPFPTVAVIEGFCLGGGLELALAFSYRIAKDVDSTRIGFPEVRLGIYPGFGGSARSVRTCGPLKAMPLMLSGRMLRARAARGAGLVDELVGPHGELRWAARRAILQSRKSRGPGRIASLQNLPPVRRLLAGQMRKQTAARANPDHYPAPFELIDAWESFGDDPYRMMEEEAVRVGRLIVGDTSRNLRRVFELSERLKAYGKESSFRARRVHVIGAGVMGGDIAAWCVVQGLEVTLQDREMKYVEPALARAKSLFRKKLRSPDRVAGAMSRLLPDVEGLGAARADVVIEAIFEDANAKRALYADIEPKLRKHAVLATNTSAIPLEDLSSELENPERLIGLHFFNPVAKMPLVEVVYGPDSSRTQVQKGAAFCNQINRFPLPVKSSPGFLVNRVLAPYMLQAFKMNLEQGIPAEALDKAATRFGMPMGPVELADVVGLDIGLQVVGKLGGPEAAGPRETLEQYVEAGKLGKKSGEGFYRWVKGKPQKNKSAAEGHDLETIAKELLAPYFAECRAALGDQVVEDADVLDAGMIFGTGFAPFRGGPLHYLRQQGAAAPASAAVERKPSGQDAGRETDQGSPDPGPDEGAEEKNDE